MKKLAIGILAHVDAGKTTLAEALLYKSGKIKKLGRVDHRNTYLDTHEFERARGITIFSKQATLTIGDMDITLLDTPGHTDFSGECERTLSVIDYAILVISGLDGVQSHTETIWELLSKYKVPTFIFITKMDLSQKSREELLSDLSANLSPQCVDMTDESEDGEEHIAMCDETLLEKYASGEKISDGDIKKLVIDRKIFPCYFGSGLKLDGLDRFTEDLDRFTEEKKYPDEFGARVYKITRDPSGVRLTHMKITGGRLSVRSPIEYTPHGGEEEIEEKVAMLRRYSGAKFESVEEVRAGDICAAAGLSGTYIGEGLGIEKETVSPFLEPILNYRINLPKDADPKKLFQRLKELEEEEPLLNIVWNERFSEIHAQIMGDVQTEILCGLISERFGVNVTFDEGSILYRETVSKPVEGIGHFEPLRHYSEVHLIIEPGERGSGVVYENKCPDGILAGNWQRLILSNLAEKQHIGVLTGSPLTDVRIVLISGRAHVKHTQGGDFREAAYRAVRQGLMCAENILLEPYYNFRLELPGEFLGRAMSDIAFRHGSFTEHETTPGTSVLTGRAPVSDIADYAREVASYTHGRGKLSLRSDGYYPCHNTEEIVARSAYDPEADLSNTPDSVFCAHGAGFVVPWNEVRDYMHIEAADISDDEIKPIEPKLIKKNLDIDEKELEAIMQREFGPIKRRVYSEPEKPFMPDVKTKKYKKSLYIIDAYNVIFAWEELAAVAEYDLEGARHQLCDILANYKAFTGRDIILVFDAYNVKGALERKFYYNGVNVVYTKEGELGDTYIEKLTNKIGQDYSVRVITSDGMIQLQAVRSGVLRMSASEFKVEITSADLEIAEILRELREKSRK